MIENLIATNIKSLKDWGYLDTRTKKSGTLIWSKRGEITAEIGIMSVIGITEGVIVLAYNAGGEALRYRIKLIHRESNLGRGSFWLFTCPVTGRACRKLYLWGKYFVSRHAIPGALYERQTWSKFGRFICAVLEEHEPPRRMKRHYRGKPTPRYLRYMGKRDRQMSAISRSVLIEQALSKGKG
jgi:hypothetical protein